MALLRNNWTDGAAFAHTDQNDVANAVNAKVDLSTLTAKGDLYVATNSGTVTNLPVGSNDQVLMADSTTTTGVKWGTVANGTFADTSFVIQDDGDATKQVKFQVSGITTGTTRTFTLPDVSSTLEVTANKGAANGYAALDSDGKVPTGQLPITQADWTTLQGKPTYVAAGATKADARTAIDAEYTGNKGQPNGYASLNSSGIVPLTQIPPGVVIDGVSVGSETFQLLSGTTPIGDPISILLGSVDGGTPSSVTETHVDGGAL